MTLEIALFLLLFLVAVVLFSMEWFPADVTALGLMLALILTGLLSPEDAFAGFGSETVLMIFGLLVLTEALVNTGLVDMVGQWMLPLVGQSRLRVRLLLLIAPAIMSAFMSNTASAAFFLPIALGLANRTHTSASKLLMPLSFAAILAGSTTLIGTSTNLVVSGLMVQNGLEPLSMLEMTPVGLPILIIGLIYMGVFGYKLIPDRGETEQDHALFDSDLFFTEIVIPADSSLIGMTIEESPLINQLQLGMLELQREGDSYKPLADTVIQADDILIVEGSREEILKLTQNPEVEINGKIQELEDYARDGTARIAEVVLLPGSALIGRNIRGLGLRERYQIQILAVRRAGESRHSKIGRLIFNLGDLMLIKITDENLRLMGQERLFRVLDIIETPPQDRRLAFLASGIFVGSLAAAVFGILPIAVAVLVGVLLAFLTGCITPQVAYRNIEWKTIILIGSMLAFGQAMQQTGTADYLADIITGLPITDSPVILLGVFFVLAVILTQPMSNQAAAAVLIPIALQTAAIAGYNPRPFAIVIALAASTSFITPLEPASVIVYNAGRYKFMDFIRVGGLLTVLVFLVVILLVPLIWEL